MESPEIKIKFRPEVKVPVGLSTKVGLAVSAGLGLVSLITAFLHGDHSNDTITALGSGVATLITVLYGRQNQAAAMMAVAPSPMSTSMATQSAETGQNTTDSDYEDSDETLPADPIHPDLLSEVVGPIPVEDEGNIDALETR